LEVHGKNCRFADWGVHDHFFGAKKTRFFVFFFEFGVTIEEASLRGTRNAQVKRLA